MILNLQTVTIVRKDSLVYGPMLEQIFSNKLRSIEVHYHKLSTRPKSQWTSMLHILMIMNLQTVTIVRMNSLVYGPVGPWPCVWACSPGWSGADPGTLGTPLLSMLRRRAPRICRSSAPQCRWAGGCSPVRWPVVNESNNYCVDVDQGTVKN